MENTCYHFIITQKESFYNQSFIDAHNPATSVLIGKAPEASVADVAAVVAKGLQSQAVISATLPHRCQDLQPTPWPVNCAIREQ